MAPETQGTQSYRLSKLEEKVDKLDNKVDEKWGKLDNKVNWLIGIALVSSFTISGSVLVFAITLLATGRA